ncbi:CoA transferase [Streptomyces pinistramenti]|uniref:CoA transferase n=1 Tax=Streptomyces pinistramenti TaxID=2884812 RepID=UPI001D07B663|nr:CoA transferase [Streptomyces pinistramenti]MCB5906187.1 CoA transferase [Streptomyces pinistramenti]
MNTPAYDRRAARTSAGQAVSDLLHGSFRARDFTWWQERLDGLNAPWAPVFATPGELLADPHIAARQLLRTPAGPAACPQARFPVTFGAGLDTFRGPAQALGRHAEEMLGQLPAQRPVSSVRRVRPPGR